MTVGYLLNGSDGTISRLATVTGVSLTSQASTNLYTVPTGKTLILEEVYARITAVSGFVAAATLAIGKTPSFNEWLTATAMTSLSSVGNYRKLSLSAAGLVYNTFAAGEIVAVNVTGAATASSLTATFDVFGYLV